MRSTTGLKKRDEPLPERPPPERAPFEALSGYEPVMVFDLRPGDMDSLGSVVTGVRRNQDGEVKIRVRRQDMEYEYTRPGGDWVNVKTPRFPEQP